MTLDMFFPKTTRNDLRKSIFITALTICGFFLPSLVGEGGVFSQTTIGMIAFVFFLLYASVTIYTMTHKTKDSISEVVKLPLKTIALLSVIGIVSWMALNVLNFNSVGARIGIVTSSSLIEFVFIYNSTFYLGILFNYLVKRLHHKTANE